MQQVIIIQGNRRLESYLRRFLTSRANSYKYICCSYLNSKLISKLEEKGFKRCTDFNIDEAYRDKFLRAYIDLVSKIGKESNSRIWWATDIASKNRFTSKLAEILQQFLEITQAIKSNDYEQLLIVNPSWVIVPSLKRVLISSKVSFKSKGIFASKWREVSLRYLRRTLGIFYHFFRSLWRIVYARKTLAKKLKDISPDKFHYIVKTFIYNHSFKDGFYHDAFFGRLPEFLKSKKNLLLYACILGDYKKCLVNITDCKEYLIVPLELFLSLADILGAAKSWIFGKVKVRKNISFFGYEVKELLNNELLRTAKGVQFYQLLHYWSTKKLLKQVKAESILLTHENNPWERMCTLAARDVSPRTKVLWYQNTVIPQAAASMFLGQEEAKICPLPDFILTLGDTTKTIMQKYGSYQGLKLEPACGLKFEYLDQLVPFERKRQGNILIALEGIFESYKVVNRVLAELRNNPEYKVKLRTHPILPLKDFQHKLEFNLEKISNFRVSNGTSLKDDLNWADIVIYWGSAVALEALTMGRPVIHFDMGSVLSFDPLGELNNLRWVVNKNTSFKAAIEQIVLLTDDEFNQQRVAAKANLKSYFHSVTEDNLAKFVN